MYFDKHLCFLQLEVESKEELFEIMTNKLYEEGFVKENYLEGISTREQEYPTGLMVNGTGFAIPHTDSSRVNESQICFASLKKPIEFNDMGDMEHIVPVELVFMLAMNKPHEQLETLQKLVGLFQESKAVEELKKCDSQDKFKQLLEKAQLN
jgi:PTS system galactitol-specific IIA component